MAKQMTKQELQRKYDDLVQHCKGAHEFKDQLGNSYEVNEWFDEFEYLTGEKLPKKYDTVELTVKVKNVDLDGKELEYGTNNPFSVRVHDEYGNDFEVESVSVEDWDES